MNQPITIAGGGLAGLALGLALRREGVPVTVVEAANYPRHRVCGEFISGITEADLEALGVTDLFSRAQKHCTTGWYEDGRAWLRATLPSAAYGLSRHFLDDALAQRFTAQGGVLETGQRHEREGEGIVWASGRPRSTGGWLGVKGHYENLALAEDLEIHAQDGGYVGLTRIEDGQVNVCGLFRGTKTDGGDALAGACESAGLRHLARRLRGSRLVPGSLKGVTNFVLGWQQAQPGRVCVGDAAAMIPPFTGNGMTMALQGALAAAEPMAAWSQGRLSWDAASRQVRARQRKTFGRRLRWAQCLQWILLHRGPRRMAMAFVASGLVRFDSLYQKLR